MRLGYKHEKHAEVSRIWARQKLLQLCLPLPPRITYDPVEVVVLKDSHGELKDYPDTAYTRRLRQQLHKINRVNSTADIRLKRYQVHAHLCQALGTDSHKSIASCSGVFRGLVYELAIGHICG